MRASALFQLNLRLDNNCGAAVSAAFGRRDACTTNIATLILSCDNALGHLAFRRPWKAIVHVFGQCGPVHSHQSRFVLIVIPREFQVVCGERRCRMFRTSVRSSDRISPFVISVRILHQNQLNRAPRNRNPCCKVRVLHSVQLAESKKSRLTAWPRFCIPVRIPEIP